MAFTAAEYRTKAEEDLAQARTFSQAGTGAAPDKGAVRAQTAAVWAYLYELQTKIDAGTL